ncbi:serine hydrolase domain-containing protein [Nonomuraea typhae]|uniref:serine hydrolase domain-containing protein n=1 Tax=Nonomuraea typhae TaxID=2603600 RepID=UPI0012F7F035|nr:serine hydrolase domain-containing protein [Nonomuraea typhae]
MTDTTPIPSLDQVAGRIEELMTRHRLPSIALAIAHGDRVEARGFGLADLQGRPASGHTPYLLASVTKPVVATLCVMLAEQGLIDLDEPLADRLPWLDADRPGRPGRRGRPSVRQALNHTAGFGRYWDFAYDEAPLGIEAALDRYGVLIHEPGTRFEYANLGYGVLEPWLAAATGRPLGDLLERYLFAPLKLTSAAFGPGAAGAQAAVPYTAERHLPYPTITTSHPAASMAWMSAADLARFGLTHAHAPAWAAAVRTPGVGSGEVYGLGWNVRHPDGVEVLAHAGDMCGVGASLAVLPDLGVSAAAVVNRTGSVAQARTACEILLESLVSRIGPEESAPSPAPMPVGEWAGRVAAPSGAIPVRMGICGDATAWVEVAGTGRTPARLESDEAYDVMIAAEAQLPTPDALRASPWLELALDVGGERLTGSARAVKHGESGDRVGNCLTHWCELERVR